MVSNKSDIKSERKVVSSVAAFSEVAAACEKAVAEGTFPGCVVAVTKDGHDIFKQAFGYKSVNKVDETGLMTLDTVSDVATLTNILVTTTIIMRLVQGGRLALDDCVSHYIQSFAVNGKSSITVRQLLNHTSGLAAWQPYFEELLALDSGDRRGILTSSGAKEYVLNSINRASLKFEPGTKQIYSDIGFILLGNLIEVVTGAKLDAAAQYYVFQPLGLKNTSFIDLSKVRRRAIQLVTDMIAPTEECTWRGRVLCGEVFDDNAWAMGGIAGHSGIFSNLQDLQTFATQILRCYAGESDYIYSGILQEFWAKKDGDAWACGWEVPNKENLLADTKFSTTAVGHNGVSGCSLWLEPEQKLSILILSNRVHPLRSNKKIRTFRPILIDAIFEALDKL